MNSDTYTKMLLTIIALLLAVIAIRPLITPDTVANAQTSFAGLQVSGRAGSGVPSTSFFDSKTGDLFIYYRLAEQPDHYRLSKLGSPLNLIK